MPERTERELVAKVPEVLAALLGTAVDEVDVRNHDLLRADLVVVAAGQTFVVEVKTSAGAAAIAQAAREARELTRHARRRAIPLVAVPFMGDLGRRVCETEGVAWFDFSGNARIVAPGIRVIVEGRPNRFCRAGRPANVFAPKSARVVRWMLISYPTPLTQRQIARATDMTEGFVSRIVGRLEHEGYLDRDGGGAVRPKNPSLLLEAWREAQDFSVHAIRQGHVASRSGEELLRLTSDALAREGIEYAATGLAAAWLHTRFASFRIVTVFVPSDPPGELIRRLGFREELRGANLWLVVPRDAGVFHGVSVQDGVRCVHPVQAYVDLKDHPERAREAADQLRAGILTWSRDD